MVGVWEPAQGLGLRGAVKWEPLLHSLGMLSLSLKSTVGALWLCILGFCREKQARGRRKAQGPEPVPQCAAPGGKRGDVRGWSPNTEGQTHQSHEHTPLHTACCHAHQKEHTASTLHGVNFLTTRPFLRQGSPSKVCTKVLRDKCCLGQWWSRVAWKTLPTPSLEPVTWPCHGLPAWVATEHQGPLVPQPREAG